MILSTIQRIKNTLLKVITMSKHDRTYCKKNPKSNSVEWYFNGRQAEGTFGPFSTQEEAEQALEEFIRFNIEFGDDGGRNLKINRHEQVINAFL